MDFLQSLIRLRSYFDAEALSGAADRFRAGRGNLLDSPFQSFFIQAACGVLERYGNNDVGSARSIGCPGQETARFIDCEPTWSPLQFEPRPFHVPEIHRFLAIDHSRPEVAERSNRHHRVTVIHSRPGSGQRRANYHRPRTARVLGRPAAISLFVHGDHSIESLVGTREANTGANHLQLGGRSLTDEVRGKF